MIVLDIGNHGAVNCRRQYGEPISIAFMERAAAEIVAKHMPPQLGLRDGLPP